MIYFYELNTNGDHQENRKEILNKPGGKYIILDTIKKKKPRVRKKNVRDGVSII